MRELIAYLHTLPNAAVFVMALLLIPGLAALIPVTRQFLFRRAVSQVTSDAVLDAVKVAVAYTGVLLAFTLVQAQQNFRNAEAAIVKEASDVGDVDRLLRGLPGSAAAARSALQTYVHLLATDEWATMERRHQSAQASDAFNALVHEIRQISPADTRQEMLLSSTLPLLDRLTDHREERLLIATGGLPDLFWWAIAGLFVVILTLSAFLQPILGRLVGMTGMTVPLAMLLALVIAVDSPFAGETRVGPHAMRQALERMQRP